MMNTGYKYVLRSGKYFRKQNKELFETTRKFIGIENIKTGEVFPHPITFFLDQKYHRKSGSINTEGGAGASIVPFLNFVLDKVKEYHEEFIGVRGFPDLTVRHADLFLESCVEERGNKQSTLNQKEYYLSNFYNFLWSEKILLQRPPTVKVSKKYGNKIKTFYVMQFSYKKPDETLIREKIKRKDFVPQQHKSNVNRKLLRLNYIREFLLFAKNEAKDIALGIAFQMFSGLRDGEIVNLTRSALIPQGDSKYGEKGLILLVRDRQNELFTRLNDIDDNQVKQPRDQSSLIDPILCMLYKQHFEVYLKNVKSYKHHNALFYNTNGDPLSASGYADRFRDVKGKYLTALQFTPGRYEDFLDFSRTDWLTHIGRGVFTNMCIDAGFSAKETSVLRGDKSSQAMEDYKDLISATYNIRHALKLLEPNNIKEIIDLNLPNFQNDWKEVEKYARQLQLE